jgi:hypothetical protein
VRAKKKRVLRVILECGHGKDIETGLCRMTNERMGEIWEKKKRVGVFCPECFKYSAPVECLGNYAGEEKNLLDI